MEDYEDYEVVKLFKSKKTGKTYSTKADLKADEAKWDEAHKAEIAKAVNRKKDAAEVDAAREHYNQVCKDSDKVIKEETEKKVEARNAYYEKLNAFARKYGSYHYSITSNDLSDVNSIAGIFNFLNNLF